MELLRAGLKATRQPDRQRIGLAISRGCARMPLPPASPRICLCLRVVLLCCKPMKHVPLPHCCPEFLEEREFSGKLVGCPQNPPPAWPTLSLPSPPRPPALKPSPRCNHRALMCLESGCTAAATPRTSRTSTYAHCRAGCTNHLTICHIPVVPALCAGCHSRLNVLVQDTRCASCGFDRGFLLES